MEALKVNWPADGQIAPDLNIIRICRLKLKKQIPILNIQSSVKETYKNN